MKLYTHGLSNVNQPDLARRSARTPAHYAMVPLVAHAHLAAGAIQREAQRHGELIELLALAVAAGQHFACRRVSAPPHHTSVRDPRSSRLGK